MTHLRERWEGVCLCGNYTLEQWLGGDDGAAFFQTSLAPDGRRAVVKLVPEAAADGAGPLDLWQRIHQLRHPNLVELLDCGRADLDGEIVFYALFESPDDTLASALSRAPLNQAESREILNSVIDALRYLHAQGLAAGALDPDHIVAVGERVKVSTGALLESETSSANREDVRLLGELWQRALMPASSKSAEIASHAADPNAETRWTLAEISSALAADFQEAPAPALQPPAPPLAPSALVPPLHMESQVAAPVISEAQVEAASALNGSVSEAPVAAPQVLKPEAEVPDATPTGQAPNRYRPVPAVSFEFPKWIIAAAAGVVFFLFALHWMPPATDVTQAKATSVSHPMEPPARAPVRETAPPEPVREASRSESKVQTTPKFLAAGDEKIWRVIAFTYRSREAAAKKAQQLNEYHAGIDAAVFLPKDSGHYYLVSLGGRMTREEAERLQRSARGRGLPRDLYVQNYTR